MNNFNILFILLMPYDLCDSKQSANRKALAENLQNGPLKLLWKRVLFVIVIVRRCGTDGLLVALAAQPRARASNSQLTTTNSKNTSSDFTLKTPSSTTRPRFPFIILSNTPGVNSAPSNCHSWNTPLEGASVTVKCSHPPRSGIRDVATSASCHWRRWAEPYRS